MKKCRKCEKEKELNQYHKWKEGKDGLCHYCKECISKDRKEYLERNHGKILQRRKEQRENNSEIYRISNKKSYYKYKEKYKEKQRIYNKINREKINERQRKYNQKNREKINEKQNLYLKTEKGKKYSSDYYYKTREKFKTKRNARNKLRYAVMVGKIMKPKQCEICFENKTLHAHHENYDKPLDVKWVCIFCHKKIHEEKGN